MEGKTKQMNKKYCSRWKAPPKCEYHDPNVKQASKRDPIDDRSIPRLKVDYMFFVLQHILIIRQNKKLQRKIILY